MKEATGELNLTLITIVALAAIGGIFITFVWPQIQNNLEARTHCSGAICPGCTGTQTKQTCEYDKDGDGMATDQVTCGCEGNS